MLIHCSGKRATLHHQEAQVKMNWETITGQDFVSVLQHFHGDSSMIPSSEDVPLDSL